MKLCQSEKDFETLKLKPETRYSNISLQNKTSTPSSCNTEMKPGVSWQESLGFKAGKSDFHGRKLGGAKRPVFQVETCLSKSMNNIYII